jgi:hypothetical protein
VSLLSDPLREVESSLLPCDEANEVVDVIDFSSLLREVDTFS